MSYLTAESVSLAELGADLIGELIEVRAVERKGEAETKLVGELKGYAIQGDSYTFILEGATMTFSSVSATIHVTLWVQIEDEEVSFSKE